MAKIPVDIDFKAKGLEGIKGAFNNLLEPAAVFASSGSKASAVWAGIKTVLLTKVLGPLSLLSGIAVGVVSGFKAMFGSSMLLKKGMEQVRDIEYTTRQFAPLLNGIENAKQHVQALYQFAANTPFQIGDIAGASKQLEILTKGALGGVENLKMIADAAAVSGQGMQSVGMWTARLYSGLQAGRPVGEALARLQEMGLVTAQTRQKIEDGTKSGKSFSEMWREVKSELGRNEGASKELSQTLGGLESTLIDVKAKFQGEFAGHFLEGEKEGTKRAIAAFETLEGPVSEMGFWFSKVYNAWEKFKTSMATGFGMFEGAGNTLGKVVTALVALGAAIMAAQIFIAARGLGQMAAAGGRAAASAQFHGIMEIFRTQGLMASVKAFWALNTGAKMSTITMGIWKAMTKGVTFVTKIFTNALRDAWKAMLKNPILAVVAVLAAAAVMWYRHNAAVDAANKKADEITEGAKKATEAIREEAAAVKDLAGKLQLIGKTATSAEGAHTQMMKAKEKMQESGVEGMRTSGGALNQLTMGASGVTDRETSSIEYEAASKAYEQQKDLLREIIDIDTEHMSMTKERAKMLQDEIKLQKELKEGVFSRAMAETSDAGKLVLLAAKRGELERKIASARETTTQQADLSADQARLEILKAQTNAEFKLMQLRNKEDTQQGKAELSGFKQDASNMNVAQGMASLGVIPILKGLGWESDQDEEIKSIEEALTAVVAQSKEYGNTLTELETEQLNDLQSRFEDMNGLIALSDKEMENFQDHLQNMSSGKIEMAINGQYRYTAAAAESIEELRSLESQLQEIKSGAMIELDMMTGNGKKEVTDFSDELQEKMKAVSDKTGLDFGNMFSKHKGGGEDQVNMEDIGTTDEGKKMRALMGTSVRDKLYGEQDDEGSGKDIEGQWGDADSKKAEYNAITAIEGKIVSIKSLEMNRTKLSQDQLTQMRTVLDAKKTEAKELNAMEKRLQSIGFQEAEINENLKMRIALREIDKGLQTELLALGLKTYENDTKKQAAEKKALEAKQKQLQSKDRDKGRGTSDMLDLQLEKAQSGRVGQQSADGGMLSGDLAKLKEYQAARSGAGASEEANAQLANSEAIFASQTAQDAYIATIEEAIAANAKDDQELQKVTDSLDQLAAASRETQEALRRLLEEYNHLIQMEELNLDVEIAIKDEAFGRAHDSMKLMNGLLEDRIQLERHIELQAQNLGKLVIERIVRQEAFNRATEKGLTIQKMMLAATKTQERSALAMQARGGDQDARKKLEGLENKDFFKEQLKAGVGAGLGKEANITQAQQLLNAKLMDEVGESKITADSMRKIGAGGFADSTDPMKRLAEKQLEAQKAVLPLLKEMLDIQRNTMQNLPGKPVPLL